MGKKITVKSTGKMDATKLDLTADNVDHHAALMKNTAQSSEDENSMSSDDTDFNPDALEAKEAKEEYDSDPSDTGSDGEGGGGGEGGEDESGSEAEEKED